MSALCLHTFLGSLPLLASSAEAASITPAPPWIMLLFAAIMLATYVGVAIEPMHKTVAALCGAVILVGLSLALGLFEYEKIYDMLLNSKTADKVTVHFKDGRSSTGALIFNPFKGSGRVIDVDKESSIDFAIEDVRELKLS